MVSAQPTPTDRLSAAQAVNETLRGHYAYYGITGNSRALTRFHREVRECWQKWLNRRNRKRTMGWSVFQRLLQRYPLTPDTNIHGRPRYEVDYTDSGHPTHESYVQGNPSERALDILL